MLNNLLLIVNYNILNLKHLFDTLKTNTNITSFSIKNTSISSLEELQSLSDMIKYNTTIEYLNLNNCIQINNPENFCFYDSLINNKIITKLKIEPNINNKLNFYKNYYEKIKILIKYNHVINKLDIQPKLLCLAKYIPNLKKI